MKEERRPLTLAPLSFKEAVADLLKIKPAPKARSPKTRRAKVPKGPAGQK
jgi:hypothetical protein